MKATISSSRSLNSQLSSTCKLEKIKFEHKQQTETCNWSNFQLKSSSILKLIIYTVFTSNWAKIMNKKFYLQSVMKYWEQLLLNFRPLNCWPKEIKCPKESDHCCHKEQPISTSLLTILLSLNWPLAKIIWKQLKANKWHNKMQKEQSIKSTKQSRQRNQQSLRPKLQLVRLSWWEKPPSTTHVIFHLKAAYLDVRKIEYS